MTPSALEIPSLKGKVSDEEWAVRVDLAAAYRLVSRYGWEDLVFTHISARVPGTEDQFLINPYGLFFDEITAWATWERTKTAWVCPGASRSSVKRPRPVRSGPSSLRRPPATAPKRSEDSRSVN